MGRNAARLAVLLLLIPSVCLGADTDEGPASARLDPDFAAGKKAIESKDWAAAIKSLSSAALRDTRNADIQNDLGYAYRNAGQVELAFKHYERALQLNPRHRGAHEYVGEAYLLVGNLTKAEEHLAALQKICLIPCEEYGDLKKEIDAYRKRISVKAP
jgi:Flp pilus assembly protein TadD